MKIQRKSLMDTPMGLFTALTAAAAGIVAAYIVDDNITVLERANGTFGFKDHKTGKEPPKKVQKEIIKAIKEGK